MRYEYEREDGERIVRSFPMGEAPSSFIEDDGVAARRVYTAPLVTIRGDDTAAQDESKRLEEVRGYAREIGIETLSPMKGQNAERQLRDLRGNRNAFAEKMAKAREESQRNAAAKMRQKAEAARSQSTIENYLKRQERKARADYTKRSGSI